MTLPRIQPSSCLLALIASAVIADSDLARAQFDTPSGDSLPIAEWIAEGEHEEFDWDLDIGNARLQMGQHFEIEVTAHVEAGDLDEATEDHLLSLVTVVTDREGEWLGVSEVLRETLPPEAHEDTGVEFESYISLIPGRYEVWVVLFDETTGQRNVVRERKEVDAIGNDPLAGVYDTFPAVEFARIIHSAGLTVREISSDLSIPISARRPLEIELVATLSAPEQWQGGGAITRHIENLLAGLTALSQLDVARGSVSITGLDLLRRSLVFEHAGDRPVDWAVLRNTFERVNRSAVSVDALLGREENAAFFRDYVVDRASTRPLDTANPPGPDEPLRVMIVVAGVMRFDDDADKSPVEPEAECDCRVYHIRFKQNLTDLFDQLDDVLEPFDPPTYDVVSARDFRRVIGEIVEDLGRP